MRDGACGLDATVKQSFASAASANRGAPRRHQRRRVLRGSDAVRVLPRLLTRGERAERTAASTVRAPDARVLAKQS